MAFQLDEQLTLDFMATSSTVDLMSGDITLYAVVCVGSVNEPHASHGGQLSVSSTTCIEAAKQNNEATASAGDDGCRYLAAAVGISRHELFQLAMLLSGQDIQEPGDG